MQVTTIVVLAKKTITAVDNRTGPGVIFGDNGNEIATGFSKKTPAPLPLWQRIQVYIVVSSRNQLFSVPTKIFRWSVSSSVHVPLGLMPSNMESIPP